LSIWWRRQLGRRPNRFEAPPTVAEGNEGGLVHRSAGHVTDDESYHAAAAVTVLIVRRLFPTSAENHCRRSNLQHRRRMRVGQQRTGLRVYFDRFLGSDRSTVGRNSRRRRWDGRCGGARKKIITRLF